MEASRRAVIGRIGAGVAGTVGVAGLASAGSCADWVVDLIGEGSYEIEFQKCSNFSYRVEYGEGEDSLDGDSFAATGTVGSDGSERWYLNDAADVQVDNSETDDTVDVFVAK